MKKIQFGSSGKDSKSIEVTLQVRDKNGNPTGQTRTFGSDNHRDVDDWYKKQSPQKKRKKRKKRLDS